MKQERSNVIALISKLPSKSNKSKRDCFLFCFVRMVYLQFTMDAVAQHQYTIYRNFSANK